MSKIWKWILGVLAVLAIIAVVAAAAFVWWNHSPMTLRSSVARPQVSGTPAPNAPSGQNGPAMPYGFEKGRRYRMDGWGMGGPMMRGRGFPGYGGFTRFGLGFFILGAFLRLLIPLGILALVAFIFYRLGKHAGATSAASAPPSTPIRPQAPPRKVAKS